MKTLFDLTYDEKARVSLSRDLIASEKIDGMSLSAMVDEAGTVWFKTRKSDWCLDYQKWYEKKFQCEATELVKNIHFVIRILSRSFALCSALRHRVIRDPSLLNTPFTFEILSSYLSAPTLTRHYKQVRTTYFLNSESFIAVVAHDFCPYFFEYYNSINAEFPIEDVSVFVFPPNRLLFSLPKETIDKNVDIVTNFTGSVKERREKINKAAANFYAGFVGLLSRTPMRTLFNCDQPEGLVLTTLHDKVSFKFINVEWQDLPISKHFLEKQEA